MVLDMLVAASPQADEDDGVIDAIAPVAAPRVQWSPPPTPSRAPGVLALENIPSDFTRSLVRLREVREEFFSLSWSEAGFLYSQHMSLLSFLWLCGISWAMSLSLVWTEVSFVFLNRWISKTTETCLHSRGRMCSSDAGTATTTFVL